MNESFSLRSLKGIGEKTEKLFQKLYIYTIGDLLRYYPRDYNTFETPLEVDQIAESSAKTGVMGIITKNIQVRHTGRNSIIATAIEGHHKRLTLMWFNMPFLRNVLKRGNSYIFRGKISEKRSELIMEHPEMYAPEEYQKLLHTMQPIYALTSGLNNNLIRKTVLQALQAREMAVDYLPEQFRSTYQLAEYNYAVSEIHFPKDQEHMLLARRRFVFDEFFLFILAVSQLKEKQEDSINEFHMKSVSETGQILEQLPYRLTNAQSQVWSEIESDMTGSGLMSRLVQGDVGSGKTIIAFLAMVLTAVNGYQSALMVPTEVLARQHFDSFTKLLSEHDLMKYQPVLLTGSNTAKEKREVYDKIANGSSKIIIGTHALFQEKVTYENLAFVITDEQHRFGVKQREFLSGKGRNPHLLVMSATPIPRTLAIILYGDCDISVIDELPAKRLPVKNCVVTTRFRPQAYTLIKKEVACGRQAYVICPMVEKSEEMDAENVTDYARQLRSVFPESIVIEVLHGRMKPAQKNDIMEAFAQNKIHILVSTTVVEVGVNVPNATVMMVENAERFGLAGLHQLRGRVGRGEYQSYCIFMHENTGENTQERLKLLEKSNSGFFIAEEDLKLRGPGDLFGLRQSGLLEFQIADIFQDASVLKEASQAAQRLIRSGWEFDPQYKLLKEKLQEYMQHKINI